MSGKTICDEKVGTLWRALEEIPEVDCRANSLYLIYDQKGYGLDLVLLSRDLDSFPYIRIMESKLGTFFEKVDASSGRLDIEEWIKKRMGLIRQVISEDPEELLANVNDRQSEEAYCRVLKVLARYQAGFDELKRRVEFLKEYPDLEIYTDRPVRRRVGANRNPSTSKIGRVVGVADQGEGYFAWVRWDDETEEYVAVVDLENAPE